MCTRVLICSTEFAPPTKVEQIRTRVLICTSVHFHKTPFIKFMTKIHPRCKFTPRVYICTGVYIVHMNEALDGRLMVTVNFIIFLTMHCSASDLRLKDLSCLMDTRDHITSQQNSKLYSFVTCTCKRVHLKGWCQYRDMSFLFNPLVPNVISGPYQLDESISNLRVVR